MGIVSISVPARYFFGGIIFIGCIERLCSLLLRMIAAKLVKRFHATVKRRHAQDFFTLAIRLFQARWSWRGVCEFLRRKKGKKRKRGCGQKMSAPYQSDRILPRFCERLGGRGNFRLSNVIDYDPCFMCRSSKMGMDW